MSCVGEDVYAGSCHSGSIGDGGATLDGSIHDDGTNSGDGVVWVDGGEHSEDDPVCARRVRDLCLESPVEPAPPDQPRLTITDVAHFAPAAPTLTSQPAGWAVVGLPANFIAPAEPHIATGLLLDRAAAVRFTPVLWRWDYGDGGSGASSTGGGRWEELGQDEFTVTPTAHTYLDRGTVSVALTVDYVADYQLDGGPWHAIDGVLSLTTEPTIVRVVRATTMLVAEDCVDNPRARGC